MTLSIIIIKLGHGIKEMPEMEEHTCRGKINLIARLVIYDSEMYLHIIFQFDSSGLKLGNLTYFIMLLPFLAMINSTALLRVLHCCSKSTVDMGIKTKVAVTAEYHLIDRLY